MQRFLTDTASSRIVSYILNNIPIPVPPTARDLDYVMSGFVYIYKNDIISVTKTGYLHMFDDQAKCAQYDVIDSYEFGESNPKITQRLIPVNNYYDSSTHKWLGEYLRKYRDIVGIDLMPFYNCFCNEYTSDYVVTEDSGVQLSTSDNYKVAEIPIKFNQTYTIAVDSPTGISFGACFMNEGVLLSVAGDDLSDSLFKSMSGSCKYYSLSNFLSPLTFKLDLSSVSSSSARAKLFRNEKYLKLLVQVPKECLSSIVVLEGDYTDLGHQKVINVEKLDALSEKEVDSVFLSNLSLLKLNDCVNYAFSDRIIEYFLNNVISFENTIKNNVLRVQDAVGYQAVYGDSSYTKDVWNRKLRKLVYEYCFNYDNSVEDINGYVDRDSEYILLQYR